MADKTRERALEAALYALYRAWSDLPIPPGKTRRYYAERFRQSIDPACKNYKGGIRAVKDIVLKPTTGFERLKKYPELTVEYLVASGEWDDLFPSPIREAARAKLTRIRE